MTDHGHFHWNELMTRDVEAAKAFFTATLGWSFDGFAMPEGTYWVAMAGGEPVGGVMDMTPVSPPDSSPQWMSYISVDDIDARIAGVEAAGGTVMRPPFDIPDVGRIAMIKDASGAVVGWITPAESPA